MVQQYTDIFKEYFILFLSKSKSNQQINVSESCNNAFFINTSLAFALKVCFKII